MQTGKSKQPQHCAHVAAYYVYGVNVWLNGLASQLLKRSASALCWLKYANDDAKLAIKFWKLSGGAE